MIEQKNNLEKKHYCYFCLNNLKEIDYKNHQLLYRYTSSYAKIVPRRKSGICTKHQRKLAEAIKRARFMALLPYVAK